MKRGERLKQIVRRRRARTTRLATAEQKQRRALEWRRGVTTNLLARYRETKTARALKRYRASRAKARQSRETTMKLAERLRESRRLLRARRQDLATFRRKLSGRLWGGSRAITNEVIAIVGGRASVTSRKRVETFGNPDSDHHISQLVADAVDFGIAEAHALKDEISSRLGGPWHLADYGSFHVTRKVGLFRRRTRTFRVQIIAGTHGTGPHLHVGVRRVG